MLQTQRRVAMLDLAMKFLLALFFTVFFPIVIFLTTILYTSDITPLLQKDLVKNHIYTQLSDQLSKLDTGDANSAIISQFIQSKFTSDYLQNKVEKAMNDSDDWIKGKTNTPPVISFKDVKDALNAQYPQLLPGIIQAAQELKQQEAQNPQLAQQNPQATKNLDMIATFAKSDFTIPLNKYLVGLKNFYTAVRILQPILAILLLLSLILLGFMNKTWPARLKWIGFTLLLGSIWGFILAFGNVEVVAFISKNVAKITDKNMQIAAPIFLQLINHYVDAFTSYQKTASIVALCAAVGCFVGLIITPKGSPKPAKANTKKK
jgi:hypothetical protein